MSRLLSVFAGIAIACMAFASLASAQDVGTPGSSEAEDSPVVQQAVILSNGGADVGVLSYCADLAGGVGAQNAANTLIADGRFGSVTVVDGDVVQPTAQDLSDQFDCVLAATDNRCGVPMPQNIKDAAANAMTGFANSGGGVALATFGFSTCIGFGGSIFGPGLSPFQGLQCGNAGAGSVSLPGVGAGNPACDRMLAGVNVVSSTFANGVSLSAGATLCAEYANAQDFLAINANGNVVGLNTFPWSAGDNSQAAYRLLLGNVMDEVCGRTVVVVIDIKFCSNPNGYNCKKRGVLPVTIFGESTLDVLDIDVSSLKLCLASDTTDCTTTAPVDSSLVDRGDPASDPGAASCTIIEGVEQNFLNPDGLLDLDVAFVSREVAALIGCGGLSKKEASPTLVLVGQLADGTPIESTPVNDPGIDQLLIQNK